MKVKTGKRFFYPDIVVACEKEKNDYYRNSPLIIVEVLSSSTRKKDHTLKRLSYQNLPSLQEYVLVEQDIVGIEVYFAAIDLYLSVEEIYARVINKELSAVS